MKLLIDADYIVYKSCAGAESEIDWGDDVIMVPLNSVRRTKYQNEKLKKIENAFFSSTDTILFFSDSVNFRKSILPVLQRTQEQKETLWIPKSNRSLKDEYEVIRMDTLEADDAMGIYATLYPDNTIVSPDKDMRQIPGKLYDLNEVTVVTPEEGYRWHMVQTLAGDQTDGYGGVPGIGVKRAI